MAMQGVARRGKARAVKTKGVAPREAYMDQVFSKVVRERDDYTCQHCHKSFRHDTGRLECSHHVSRRHRKVRWDELNAISLCHECHAHLDQHPLVHADFIRNQLGDQYAVLRERSQESGKRTPAEKKALLEALKDQLAYYQKQRKQGKRGRL